MRGRDELKGKPVTKDVSVPVVQPTPKLLPPRIDEGEATSIDDLRRQISISEENDRRIEGMPGGGIKRAERNYWAVWEWDWGLVKKGKRGAREAGKRASTKCVSWF